MKEKIKVSNLNVTYFPGKSNEFKALNDVNFSIYEGEFIIFFGPSGCGKSTLLYAISGLEKITGDVFVDGKNINKFNAREKEGYYRNSIGMVFQAYHLIPTLTITQNVELPLVAVGTKKRDRKKRALDLLTRFGVGKQMNKLPSELSGGQQQRVSICRAVVNNPSIILADEPLGNLDSKSAKEVVQLFKDLNLKFGKTVILVTHDPTYLDIANRVFFIKDGKLVDIKVNENVVNDIVVRENVDATNFHKDNKGKEDKTEEKEISLLRSYKAKNMATLALADLSVEEFDRFKNTIEKALETNDFDSVKRFLDVNSEDGGLGLDKRKAISITKRLKILASILKATDSLPIVDSTHERTKNVETVEKRKEIILRKALLEELNLKIKNIEILKIIDKAIIERLRGNIDRKELLLCLNSKTKDGGAGLDRRLSNRVAKRLEIFLMGHKE